MAIREESMSRRPQPSRKKSSRGSILFRRTTALVSAGALIASALMIITSCSKQEAESSSEVEMTYTSKVETTPAVTTPAPEPVLTLLPGAQERLDRNPDSAGWLTIDGVVDEEFVHRTDAETGNSYYLDHDIDGNSSVKGVIFADFRNILDGSKTSGNIVLYGHNERDNDRLGNVDQYYWGLSAAQPSLSYYKKHALINLSTNYTQRQYKIFAIFSTNTLPQHDNGNVFDYHNYIDLSDETRYNDFISNVMERSYIDTGIDVQYGDKFLTLSTCGTQYDGQRVVVVGRQVREGESADIDLDQVKMNDYKLPAIFN